MWVQWRTPSRNLISESIRYTCILSIEYRNLVQKASPAGCIFESPRQPCPDRSTPPFNNGEKQSFVRPLEVFHPKPHSLQPQVTWQPIFRPSSSMAWRCPSTPLGIVIYLKAPYITITGWLAHQWQSQYAIVFDSPLPNRGVARCNAYCGLVAYLIAVVGSNLRSQFFFTNRIKLCTLYNQKKISNSCDKSDWTFP